MWKYVLAGILFLGFLTASVLGVFVIKKQKDIIIFSRMGHQTNAIEILQVNAALLLMVFFVYRKMFLYVPVVVVFILFAMITTRVQSGISEQGVFIGFTFIEWSKIKTYKIINDDMNTFLLKVRANKRQYVLRCNKENKAQVVELLNKHGKKVMETRK